jgi:biotin operon repressor
MQIRIKSTRKHTLERRSRSRIVHVTSAAAAAQIRDDLGITKKHVQNAVRALKESGVKLAA